MSPEQSWKLKQAKAEIKRKFAIICPECANRTSGPRASKLLPQEKCKLHDYRDPRVRTAETDYFAAAGGRPWSNT